jgi:signal peptide peptidase SppA
MSDTVRLAGVEVPRVELLLGPWAIFEDTFHTLLARAASVNMREHVAAYGDSPALESYGFDLTAEGVAVIEMNGPLTKHTMSLEAGTSTVMMRRTIRAAARDPRVKAIMLKVDSPGGTVSGTRDLAEVVAQATAQMPVHVYIEDLGASAAYWVASQAAHISTSPSSMVGSIGTYGVLYDQSGMFAREGIKAIVIRAGAFKGAGEPGTEITAEQREDYQRVVNELNAQFLAAVSAGRRMDPERVAQIADGRVHIGESARALGLVDSVESFDSAMSRLTALAVGSQPTRGSDPQRRTTMSANVAPVAGENAAATIAEIEAACPGAPASFVLAQAKAGASAFAALRAWSAEQSRMIKANYEKEEDAKKAMEEEEEEAKKAAMEKEEEEAKKARARAKGVTPARAIASRGAVADSGDPVSEFNAQVKAAMDGGLDYTRALSRVVRENPDLHRAYLDAANAR